MEQHLSEQEIQRRKDLQEIINLGINPYPAALFPVNASADEILKNFDEKDSNFQEVCVAGRLMSRRVMGKASFGEIMDSSGRIQCYFNRDEICESEDKTMYNTVFKKLLGLGDFIGVKGHVFKTQTGHTSIHVKDLTVLSKSIKPLPNVVVDADGKVHDAFSNLNNDTASDM